MRLLSAYLWKEWRDHRAVLLGMVLAVPLLLAVSALALPRTALDVAVQRDAFASFVTIACLALFVVSLATDLVPGETRRGHRWFLERTPGGLGAAFRAKLALFAGGGALFAAYGYVAAAVICRIASGEWPPSPSANNSTWVLAIASLWTFAVSCALPRGALSLPAAAALALLLALPAILLASLFPAFYLRDWCRWESGALWLAGGVVAAWMAFRRNGFLRAGRACLAVGAVCAMPFWADAAYDVYRWRTNGVPDFAGGFVGEGGHYLFLNRYARHETRGYWQSTPMAPVIVDLARADAREVGSPLAGFDATGDWRWYESVSIAQRYVRLTEPNRVTVLDARTAEEASPGENDLRAARRLGSPWRLGDGRRAWFSDGKLEADTEDGGFEVLAKPDWSACGLGLTRNRAMYYDLFRERAYKRRDLALRGERVWIRPGRWLTAKNNVYRLFDPDANEFGPVAGLEAADAVRVVADDGRLFVRRQGMPALVDPETGVTTVLAVAPELLDATVVEAARAFDRPTRTPGGRRVVLLYGPMGGGGPEVYWCALARLDPGDKLATTAALRGYTTLLGCPNDDEAIVTLNGETVVRLRFGSDEKQEIWRVR
ncbi:MAG TPA: hypothetical protein VFY93_13230 [Planctomycetota bacterium]|nr:hypothetical protein [Planctomycetota bacterium]